MHFLVPSHKENFGERLQYHMHYERNKIIEAAEKLLVGESTEVVFHGMQGGFYKSEDQIEIEFDGWKGMFDIEAEGITVKIARVA